MDQVLSHGVGMGLERQDVCTVRLRVQELTAQQRTKNLASLRKYAFLSIYLKKVCLNGQIPVNDSLFILLRKVITYL